MAATLAGGMKALIEQAGLGVAVYRERSAKEAVLPFVTIDEGVAQTDERHGDSGDASAHHGVAETTTVHLWQRWRTDAGQPAESYALIDALWAALKHAQPFEFGTPARRVYGFRLDGRARLIEAEANVIHDALTVVARRDV